MSAVSTHEVEIVGISPTSPNAVTGQTARVSIRVAPKYEGGAMPTGKVTVSAEDGSGHVKACASEVTLDGAGLGSCTLTFMHAATWQVTAQYAGDDNYSAGASSTAAYTVTKAATQTFIALDPISPVSGQTVAVTAVVSPVTPGTGVATGTVEVTVDTAEHCTITLTDQSNGQGTCNLAFATVGSGTRTISAGFSESADYTGSSSLAATLTVGKASTTVSLTGVGSTPTRR